jgi:hypothetical protein
MFSYLETKLVVSSNLWGRGNMEVVMLVAVVVVTTHLYDTKKKVRNEQTEVFFARYVML